MLKEIDGEDFVARLAELGMSQRGFADYVGHHENSVSNWAHGDPIPGSVRRCLMLMRFLHGHYRRGLEKD